MKKRKFVEREVNHTYQRTISGFNIFYEVEDYLVYYTIYSVMARKYEIVVYGLCLMIDHIHSLCAATDRDRFSRFMSHVSNVFVKEYNREHARSGSLFEARFGSAIKLGLKLIRTAIAYLYNNPVERYLCKYAQEYRWNFLAYGQSANPFSDPLILRNASSALRRAVKEVNESHMARRHLTYAQLRRLFATLDNSEKNQLIDHIVTCYSVIRYDILSTECYDGFSNMLIAINSNAGSEYDIDELKFGRSDVEYRELYRYVHSLGYTSAGDVMSLDVYERLTLYDEMRRYTSANHYQICKFLHLSSDLTVKRGV